MSIGDQAASSQTSGEPIDEAEALARLEQTNDQSAQYYAAWWLGRNRSRNPEAVPLLLRALRQRQPRQGDQGVEHNAVARNAARALGKLEASEAIPDLLECLDDDDDGLREASARALGELAAVTAIPAICARLASGPAVAGAPLEGTSRLQEPCEALLEALGEIGQAEPAVLEVIEAYVGHGRPLVHSAACRALLQLTGERRWGEPLLELLNHPQLQIRRSALMDLGAAGWRPALGAISSTLAENSLKLIALRGLVENGPGRAAEGQPPDAGPDTLAVLAAMDALL